jgi:hypothetical protein
MDVIERLEKKFDKAMPVPPPRGQPNPELPAATVPPANWRDSQTVVALADYLAARPWARLGTYAGRHVGIRFNPGIAPRDEDRWAEACRAWSMLCNALDDIEYLIGHGRLRLPVIEAKPLRIRYYPKGKRSQKQQDST